ncbi:MAG: Gfo/Idh/MocA family oxidoreductase [Candidatus Anammoximicrobium sp.]|nr:Gfo/Idh/MocA family oxidoreductase [Candidatus Anammoximicrobium sp.]
MSQSTRRSFLRQTACGTAAAAWGALAAPAIQARGANERLVVGIAGCSDRGIAVGTELRKLGVPIACVCDPDQARAARARKLLEADQEGPDLRRILDDRAVDAIVIAAPNHWHAPAAVLACQAGKHVYVEKPCSHNIAEGRRMIEAARRSGRVMQVGSQIRGTKVFQEGLALVHEGAVGKVLVAKTWVSRMRPNIGHCQPSEPPPGLDYDLWVGPAPLIPYQKNLLHYNWHWWYNFGNGDAGSRGVHQLDIALWGLDIKTHPTRITGFGEKLYFDDDKQYPDTHYVMFEYPGDGGLGSKRLIVYEQRLWSPYWGQVDCEDGCTFYGDEGYLTVDMHQGWKLFGPKSVLRRQAQKYFDTGEHCADFLEAIRNGGRPSADIEIGHLSATLPHLTNILARTGRPQLTFDPQTEKFIDAPDADALTTRTYREGHWARL